MSGKILKVASNDLYGNADDRIVRVYACFCHTKYMNNYVVFSFDGDNKLCFGSIHLKENSLVIFKVKDEIEKYISDFLNEYFSDKLKKFSILNLDNIVKVELVSYNEMDFEKLSLLDEKTIPRVITEEVQNKEKKPIFLYIIVMFLILLAVVVTYLYFNPELLTVKYKGLVCTNNLYDNNIDMYYDIEEKILFNEHNKVDGIDVVRTYTFLDSDSYFKFKNSDNLDSLFNEGEGYKFIDGEFKFKVFYKETSVIDDYDEMLTYLRRDGFSCVEREYEK